MTAVIDRKTMMIRTKIFTALLLMLLIPAARAHVSAQQVLSPDGRIVFKAFLENGLLHYSIHKNGTTVIASSSMGLIVDKISLANATTINRTAGKTIRLSYPFRGIKSLVNTSYNEAILRIAAEQPFGLEVKVFNDGVAFRYVLSQGGSIDAELTSFHLPARSLVWSQGDINYYEGNYKMQLVEEVKAGQRVGPPLTFKLDGSTTYAAVTEAGLIDFAGMSLKYEGMGKYTATLTGPSIIAGKPTPATPWRVVMVADDLNALVNNNIISAVSPPMDPLLFPNGYATTWLKPGKSLWSWLAENGPVSFENMKKFSAWAGELGFAYNLVDEGWDNWKNGDKDKWALMKELVDYAAARGVKIWVWKAYPNRNGIPGIADSTDRIAFFRKCKEIGIAGLKIDFFDTESQEIIRFYQAALKDAAKMQLMLNFHGANKPTGESRTWPNEMTREGILGLEAGAMGPRHNITVLFTRMLAGHADFTPLSFEPGFVKGTTLSHQVASIAALTSPFMCLAVDPEKLLNSEVKDMVQQIPVVWDQTIVLPQSRIGELAIMARRSGSSWFLVALNGEAPTELSVDLNFLGKGNYKGTTIADDPYKAGIKLEDVVYNRDGKIKITMPAGGGFIGRFDKNIK